MNLSLSARIMRNLHLVASGFDLTDQRRPEQFGFTLTDGDYPTPGRRFVLELRADW